MLKTKKKCKVDQNKNYSDNIGIKFKTEMYTRKCLVNIDGIDV